MGHLIPEIAHRLSMLCRFGGRVRKFYSVAEHSVRVSYMVPDDLALCGLLHDATEAFLGDVIMPLKNLRGMEYYRSLEDGLGKVLSTHFKTPWPIPAEVEEADKEAARQEGMALVPGWERPPKVTLFSPVQCWSPHQARAKFLARYEELSHGTV